MTDVYPDCLPPAGSIGLVHVTGVGGELIRLAQWADGDGFEDFEHAFILYTRGDSAESSTVIEAEPGGVRHTSLAEYRGRQVLWLECPKEYSAAMMMAAATYVGVPYSFTDYAAVAAHRLHLLMADVIRVVVDVNHHMMCSQLAVACADKAGWQLDPEIWPGYVTPGKLARLAPEDEVPQLIR